MGWRRSPFPEHPQAYELSGLRALHPITGRILPVYAAEYALAEHGPDEADMTPLDRFIARVAVQYGDFAAMEATNWLAGVRPDMSNSDTSREDLLEMALGRDAIACHIPHSAGIRTVSVRDRVSTASL